MSKCELNFAHASWRSEGQCSPKVLLSELWVSLPRWILFFLLPSQSYFLANKPVPLWISDFFLTPQKCFPCFLLLCFISYYHMFRIGYSSEEGNCTISTGAITSKSIYLKVYKNDIKNKINDLSYALWAWGLDFPCHLIWERDAGSCAVGVFVLVGAKVLVGEC